MIKLAFNKAEPNLVYAIDGVVREPINGGIVEYYIGTLKDTSTVPDTELANYKIQVMAFEQKWSFVPVDVSGTGSVNNQSKTVDPTTTKATIKPDTGYTGLDKVTVNAVTSAIDSNIAAGNIKSGVSILGVTGSYVKPDDANLIPGNIKKNVTIYGVTGSYEGSATLPSDEMGVYLNVSSSSTEEIDLLQAIDYVIVQGIFSLAPTLGAIPAVIIGTNLTFVCTIDPTSGSTCTITTDSSTYSGELEEDLETGDYSWTVTEVV